MNDYQGTGNFTGDSGVAYSGEVYAGGEDMSMSDAVHIITRIETGTLKWGTVLIHGVIYRVAHRGGGKGGAEYEAVIPPAYAFVMNAGETVKGEEGDGSDFNYLMQPGQVNNYWAKYYIDTNKKPTVELSWDTVDNASSYLIQRAGKTIATVSQPVHIWKKDVASYKISNPSQGYKDTGMAMGTYVYIVSPRNKYAGTPVFSIPASITVTDEPLLDGLKYIGYMILISVLIIAAYLCYRYFRGA